MGSKIQEIAYVKTTYCVLWFILKVLLLFWICKENISYMFLKEIINVK